MPNKTYYSAYIPLVYYSTEICINKIRLELSADFVLFEI